jgi:hypothetical protein
VETEKRAAIRRRRILFGAHLLFFVIARLVIVQGPVSEAPPAIYEAFWAWGALMLGHWLLLSIQDGRDGAQLPFRQLNRLVVPRERRWLLFIIDAMLWFISEAGVAGLLIPGYYLARYEAPISVLWTLQTLILAVHMGLASYAEINERMTATKRKNDDKAKGALIQADDGELIDFPALEEQPKQRVQRD